MSAGNTTKHFLDTSIVRPLIHGTRAYRQYFADEFGSDPCYVSQYVLMEFRRSFVENLIAFYFVLELPTIQTFGDALQLWSNEYQSARQKAVLQLVSQLLDTGRLSSHDPRDLDKARREVGRFIKRVEAKLRKFKDSSKDTTQCARAAVKLKINLARLSDDLQEFVDAFGDTNLCRSRCRIDEVILNRYRTHVEGYVTASKSLPKNAENKGFIKIGEKLEKVLTDGSDACSCKLCGQIGDAVIALDAPRTMRLEHTDKAFNHLCPPIDQPHQAHPSEIRILKG